MPDHERADRGEPADDDGSAADDQVDEVIRQDPDAPALGAVDDGTRLADPPEPHEPA